MSLETDTAFLRTPAKTIESPGGGGEVESDARGHACRKRLKISLSLDRRDDAKRWSALSS
jgi:hypothetical protein